MIGTPATLRDRFGRTARRLRRVGADPALATIDDIEHLARAHGVPEPRVWVISDRMREAELDPGLVWSWVLAFDGTELAALCGSDLSDVYVAEHVHEQTLPALGLTRSLLSS